MAGTKRPVHPDWQEVAATFRRAGMSDDAVMDRIAADYGVNVDRANLARLRSGLTRMPRYDIGAALLNAASELEEPESG